MNRKKNCWEHHCCGREPRGAKIDKLGVCPATTNTMTHGINGGINGGRACWIVEGTLCAGEVQGSYTRKIARCMQCDFYAAVRREEGNTYQGSREIIKLNQEKSTVPGPKLTATSD